MDNLIIYKIDLPPTGDKLKMIVMEYHKGRREAYPKVIRVYEKQKVEVFDSKYYLSVYHTDKSTCTLNTDKDGIHFQSHEPTSTSNYGIIYGPYENVSPVSFEQIEIMYTYAYPLPYFKKATRDIFVSHWGQISIDEYFDIFNEAAGINGQFSRVDYMPHINPNHGQNAINSLGTLLPQYINSLYYYDYIGNISSSHAERKEDHVFFNIEPRFPIFGQWKTDWNQGYMMPTAFHLFQSPSDSTKHSLEVDFMHAYDHSLTEDYTVRVILPEGATNIHVELPGLLQGKP